MIFSKDRSRS